MEQLELFARNPAAPITVRQARGRTNYYSGKAAEESVARVCEARGQHVLKKRWRGRGGEVDLVTRDKDEIVFIEVKQSSTAARASRSLGARQMGRLMSAAEEYIGGEPMGLLTAMRIDVALVDGQGHVEFIENAVGAM